MYKRQVQYESYANIAHSGGAVRDKLKNLPSTGGITPGGDDRLDASAIKGVAVITPLSQTAYDALTTKVASVLYIITDPPAEDG